MENAQYSVRFLKNSAKIYKETLRGPTKKILANTKYNSKKNKSISQLVLNYCTIPHKFIKTSER